MTGCVYIGGGCAPDQACSFAYPGAGDGSNTFACSDGYYTYVGNCTCYLVED